ncbi:MAG: DUF4405 domain-containing protein [Coprobacillaceae bacterium]
MKPKQIIKIIIDIIMTSLLLFLKAYTHTGQETHEWLGVTMFVLFLVHNILNKNWYRSIANGKYNAYRVFMTCLNILIIITVISLMVSGISMSNYVLKSVDIMTASSARKIHMMASYWGFALISIHLGVHWRMITSMIKKMLNLDFTNKVSHLIVKYLSIIIMIFGIIFLIKHDLLLYMFLRTEFVYFDYTKSLSGFLFEYLIILSMYVGVGYYISMYIRRLQKKKKAKVNEKN